MTWCDDCGQEIASRAAWEAHECPRGCDCGSRREPVATCLRCGERHCDDCSGWHYGEECLSVEMEAA